METAQQSQIVTITPKAAEKVAEFMKQEGKDNLLLRVYVSGGGCSGLSYGMGFEEKADEDDKVLEQNGVKVLIDSYSQNYLKGANIDYIDSLMGSGFKINNPLIFIASTTLFTANIVLAFLILTLYFSYTLKTSLNAFVMFVSSLSFTSFSDQYSLLRFCSHSK